MVDAGVVALYFLAVCSFITLVVGGGDTVSVKAVAERHGRAAHPDDLAPIAAVLKPDETQFRTTVGHCDCGTALGWRLRDTPDYEMSVCKSKIEKLVKKGWSSAKLGRWFDDWQKSAERRAEQRRFDSIELWCDLMHELLDLPEIRRVGLLVHHFSGPPHQEVFGPKRIRIRSHNLRARLERLRYHELVIVGRR